MQKLQAGTIGNYMFASGNAFVSEPGVPNGIIDHIDGDVISGWCLDPDNPHTLLDLELRVGDVVVASFRTGHSRIDIAQAFGVETPCGFRFEFSDIPPNLATQALDSYLDEMSREPATTARLRVTLADQLVELSRWEKTGSDLANVNLLYILRSQDALGGVKISALADVVTRTRQGNPVALPTFAGSIASEELPSFLDDMVREKSFYLLQGIEHRISDKTIDSETLVMILSTSVASRDAPLVRRVCRSLAASGRVLNIPISVVLSVSNLIADQDALLSPTRTKLPSDVLIAALNVTRDVIQRQKVIIETLCNRAG